MRDWVRFVRAHLPALDLPPEREAEIVEELALQIEQTYETALAEGETQPGAIARAEATFEGWHELAADIVGAERPVAAAIPARLTPDVERWPERAPVVGAFAQALWQDLRLTVRMHLRQPALAAVTIVTLALGIGMNTAVYSVVHSVLLRALPFADPDRLVFIHHGDELPASPTTFNEWRDWTQTLEHVTAAEYWSPNLTGRERPEQLVAVRTTGALFDLLGVEARIGRVFRADEDRPGASPVVVLSHGLWQRRFGADPASVGETLVLDGLGYTVVGVMPPDFEFPMFWATRAEMWSPLDLSPRAASRGESLRVFARLRAGVSIEQAQAEMNSFARRQAEAAPSGDLGVRNLVSPLRAVIAGDMRPTLVILLAAVGLVLLIACVNVAALFLSRATGRRGEVAIRQAIGASRGRLVRQLFTESLTLALAGGVVGLLVAGWAVAALLANLPPGTLPREGTIGVDAAVMLFTLGASLLAGILFGLAPAWGASSGIPSDALHAGRSTAGSGRSASICRALVVAEIALSLALLVGAGLLVRSFVRLQSVEPGFATDDVLTMTVSVAGTSHSGQERRIAFYRDLTDTIAAVPGVRSVSAVNHLPLSGDVWGFSVSVEGRPEPAAGDRPNAIYRVVRPGYFQTMGIPLVRGRDVTERDDRDGPPVALVNETMAERLWRGEDAVGRRFKVGRIESDNPWLTVVGVVRDTRQGDWTEPPRSEMFVPWLQEEMYLGDPSPHAAYMSLVVRSAMDPASLAPIVQRLVWDIDRDAPISGVATMREVIGDEIWRQRVSMILMGAFALAALVMAAVGVFGVMSYSVQQQTRDIGIRLALGARPRRILRDVLLQGLTLATAGIAIGLVGARWVAGWLTGVLYEVSATDVWTFSATALVLGLVALLACWLPARRAMRVDPLTLLRH